MIGAVEIPRLDAQVLGERHRRKARLRRRRKHAVDVGELEAGVVERPHRALRHQVDRARIRGDLPQVGFGCADDRDAAFLESAHFAPSAGCEDRIGRLLLVARVRAELDPHADLHLHRVDVLDAAHHAKAFVEIDQRDIERRLVLVIHDRRRVHRAEALRYLPVELRAAGHRRDGARIEHRLAVFGDLVGELAFLHVLEKDPERRLLCVRLSMPFVLSVSTGYRWVDAI